jgi:pSer/pThr/pTyr-binding forkhead associated (FHA) protein
MGYLLLPDGSEIQLTPSQRLIGRVDLARFVSPQDINMISRGHVTVYQDNTQFFVEDGRTMVQDRPSLNRTWMVQAGQRNDITGVGRCELQDGDEIDVAGVIKLLFKLR